MTSKRSSKRAGHPKSSTLTWSKLPRQYRVLNLIRQLDHVIDFLLCLLSLLDKLLEIVVHNVFSTQERIDEMLLDGKTCLDGFFSRPIFAVSFSLDKNLQTRISESAVKRRKGGPRTLVTSVSPYHRKRMASAPSVFSRRPRYSSSSSLSK
jgi:hypothetical protein